MEVTRDNFSEQLEAFELALEGADLIAIDTEFSGLVVDPKEQLDLFDSLSDRYEKIKKACTSFTIFQVGVCLFSWNGTEYEARPFNFYVFPKTGNRIFDLHRTFLCQASSLEFIASNQFDFNKWMSGVPFINHEEEWMIRKKLSSMSWDDETPIDAKHLSFVTEALESVEKWLQKGAQQPLPILCPSSFHKRLIHQQVKKRFNGFVKTETTKTAVNCIKLTADDKVKEYSKSEQLLMELEGLIGFRKIIDLVSKSRKPVIGHNMMMDLCLVHHLFYKSLPDTMDEFLLSTSTLFSSLYDTKLISTSHPKVSGKLSNSVLDDIYTSVSKLPFEFPSVKNVFDYESDKHHEAGFDAYITGLAFLRMAGYQKPNGKIDMKHPQLYEFHNKLYLMRSRITYVSLHGDHYQPDDSTLFEVYDFPTSWKSSNIYDIFRDIGNVTIKWLKDDACIVMMRDPTHVPLVEQLLLQDNPLFKIKRMKNLKRHRPIHIDEDEPPKKKRDCLIQ